MAYMTYNTYTNPFTNSHAGISITSGAVGNLSSSTFTLDFNDPVSPKIKEYKMYEVGEDALVLSVVWNRLRASGQSRTARLLDGTLFEQITTADREVAATIRDFYSKKIMMLKLKSSKRITNYREDLNKFIHSDGCFLRDDMIGLVYRLPDFYNFDVQLEEVTKSINKNVQITPNIATESTFTPLKRIERKTRATNSIQYWMREQSTGNGAMICIQSKNPLENVWNNIFNNSTNLPLYYKKQTKTLDGVEFMQLSNWGLS
jgi:hypothetical protein